MGKACSPPAGTMLCAGLCAQSRRPPAGLWWGGGAASSVRPFLGRRGAHGCSLRGPRRPLLAGGPPSRSIDGLTPANARKTGRLQRGERPGKGKNSPPSPGAKKLPLQGGGESPSLRQGAFVCCPTGHFWGRRPTAVRRRGRWILIGRRKGFIRLPFSREKGGARLFFAGAAPFPSPPEGPHPAPLTV